MFDSRAMCFPGSASQAQVKETDRACENIAKRNRIKGIQRREQLLNYMQDLISSGAIRLAEGGQAERLGFNHLSVSSQVQMASLRSGTHPIYAIGMNK